MMKQIMPAGVSIITPNWNHEYLLGQSLHSALRTVQALRTEGVPSEVIVVDDASRDGSPTLLRQLEALYFEQGLRVQLLPSNVGPAEARNHALRSATYRYILALDADNELFPENVVYFYRSSLATGAAITYGSLIVLESGEPNFITNNQSYQYVEPRIGNPVDTLCLLDRSQLLEVDGYFDSQRQMLGFEDWLLHLHLAASGRLIVFVPILLGYYHIISGSVFNQIAQEEGKLQRRHSYIRRAYDQLGIREHGLLNTRWLRYHPDLGYL